MSKILEGFPDKGLLDESFPFGVDVLKQLNLQRGQFIRGKLQALQAKYNEIVFAASTAPTSTAPPPADTTKSDPAVTYDVLFDRTWKAALTKSGQRLDLTSLATLEAELTESLGHIIELSLPLSAMPGLNKVIHRSIAVGNHDRYGFATVLGLGAASELRRMAIGFLVAVGTGMSVDLQAKFDVFSDDKAQADGLIVLHPAENPDRSSQELPPKTAEIWQESGHPGQSIRCMVSFDEIRKLLAFPGWLQAIRQEAQNIPEPSLLDFMVEHFARLFQRLTTAFERLDSNAN